MIKILGVLLLGLALVAGILWCIEFIIKTLRDILDAIDDL